MISPERRTAAFQSVWFCGVHGLGLFKASGRQALPPSKKVGGTGVKARNIARWQDASSQTVLRDKPQSFNAADASGLSGAFLTRNQSVRRHDWLYTAEFNSG